MMARGSFFGWGTLLFVLAIFVTEAFAATCSNSGNYYFYCEDGCCTSRSYSSYSYSSSYYTKCCSSTDSTSLYIALGVVFGIIILATVVTVILFKAGVFGVAKKNGVAPGSGATSLATTVTTVQQTPQPLPPNYGPPGPPPPNYGPPGPPPPNYGPPGAPPGIYGPPGPQGPPYGGADPAYPPPTYYAGTNAPY